MTGFVIVLILLLIVAILYALFRLYKLVEVIRNKEKKSEIGRSNRINAVLWMVFLVLSFALFFWYSIKEFDNYQLPIASEHGFTIDQLFWWTMGITGSVFLITHVLLFYFPYKYQYSENRRALFYPENIKLELIWTIVPAVALTGLVLYGLLVWNDVMKPMPKDAEVIEVMAYQFAWKARYPGKDKELGQYNFQLIDAVNEFGLDFNDRANFDDFVPRELHLPKGRPVEIKIRARDVLHSFFLPHFRVKMDAVPGMPTRFGFTPTKTTEEMREELGDPDFNYELACAEICGKGHFSMRMIVVVLEPEEYDKWYASQESWLSKNPDYLAKVPEKQRELAMLKAKISE